MRGIWAVLMVLCLAAGAVNAVDCPSYFTKAADKRIKFISAASSLDLTVERLNSRAEDLYNTLDDMNNDENLTTASDDFNDFVDRKNDASEDMTDLKNNLQTYENTISDSRDDLPNACFKLFNLYDDDLGEMDDYYSNVRSAWNKFTPRYDVIAGYRSNLAAHTVSEAKPKVDDIRDYIDDLSSEVTNNLPSSINATTGLTDEKIYNQTECFGMITKNVDIAIKECNAKCNLYIATLNRTGGCPVCQECLPSGDCSSQVGAIRDSLSQCESRYNELKGTCKENCPAIPVCESCADKDATIGALNTQLSASNSEKLSLNQKIVDAQVSCNATKNELSACKTNVCESCTLWKFATIGLLILIVLAWIFKM